MNNKKLWIDYIPMAFAAILIIFCAFWREQSFIKTLPTLITLVVQLMLARASRYAFLLGGLNSGLYAVSYFGEGLYFSSFFAAFISMPIQIYSYFNWKRNTANGKPDIRALSLKARLLTVAGILGAWLLCLKFIGHMISTSQYVTVDSLIFVLGAVITVLSAIRYVDAQYLGLISSVLSLALWITIVSKTPHNANYVVISAYNLFRGIEITVSWTGICIKNSREQQSKSLAK